MGDRMNTPPALIVFDLYGTLVQFGIMHHPFRKILLWAREQGRSPQPDDARKLMTTDKDCGELLATLGIFPPANMVAQLHQEIQEELDCFINRNFAVADSPNCLMMTWALRGISKHPKKLHLRCRQIQQADLG